MEQRNPPLIHNRLWRQRSLTFAASSGLREAATLQPNYRTLRETILSLLVTVLGHTWDQEDSIRLFCCWSSGNILLVFWESVQSFFLTSSSPLDPCDWYTQMEASPVGWSRGGRFRALGQKGSPKLMGEAVCSCCFYNCCNQVEGMFLWHGPIKHPVLLPGVLGVVLQSWEPISSILWDYFKGKPSVWNTPQLFSPGWPAKAVYSIGKEAYGHCLGKFMLTQTLQTVSLCAPKQCQQE